MLGTVQTPYGIYIITQLFGQNPSLYAKYKMKGHNGLDLVGPGGERRNYNFVPGEAIIAGLYGDYGKCVRIKGDDGNEWTYGHFESIDGAIKVGQRVERWQYLGVQGKTGYATGVHEHVGVRPLQGMDVNNGYKGAIDPLPFIRQIETNKLNDDAMTTQEKQAFNTLVDQVNGINDTVKEIGESLDDMGKELKNVVTVERLKKLRKRVEATVGKLERIK